MKDYVPPPETALSEDNVMKILSDILKIDLFISVAMHTCDEKKEIQAALGKAFIILVKLNETDKGHQ